MSSAFPNALFVVDHQDSVDIFAHLLGAVERLENFLLPLEKEGDGDDADCQHTFLLGDTGNDRSGSRTCSATHTGGDEHHLGLVVEELGDLLGTFLGGQTGHFRVVSGSESVAADQHTVRHRGIVQGLAVGVDDYERDAFDVLAVHMADGVVAAAAYSDYLYDDLIAGLVNEIRVLVYIFACHECSFFKSVLESVVLVSP